MRCACPWRDFLGGIVARRAGEHEVYDNSDPFLRRQEAKLPLFDRPAAADPPIARRPVAHAREIPHAGTSTSASAASRVAPKMSERRARILAFILARGSRGATDSEISRELSLRINCVPSARGWLVRAGLIEPRGTRATGHGGDGQIWVAIEFAAGGNAR
jgi:hypothetical protein